MYILALNCGSSSLKAQLIHSQTGKRSLKMKAERLDETEVQVGFGNNLESFPSKNFAFALGYTLGLLGQSLEGKKIHGIVHRVVHGGERFHAPTAITDEVIDAIDQLASLAPLHNPVNLACIKAAKEKWPGLVHVAVFDTAFHATLPKRAKSYALPQTWVEKHGIRRYGFHGSSHSYVSKKAAEHVGFPISELRIITCHLGNGASVCAVEYGRSIETSMGMTPLEGLVMGTRSGDVDPGILTFIAQKEGLSIDELDEWLNRKSGLMGIAYDNDMRDIEERAAQGDEQARLAIYVFCHRLRKYIGAYAALMGGVDAIVFTGGIGENSASIREHAAQRLEFLGALLNQDANRDAGKDKKALWDISRSNSRCKLLVIPTDEQYEMALQAASIIEEKDKVKQAELSIPIAISARHVHLTQETVEKLFGEGHELTVYKWLSQPGQFAAEERVSLIGPKNTIERVRILGPTRSKNQVEISRTDEFFLGIDAPIRASGHVENTPGITLIGPKGKVNLEEGVICAWRHIHMTSADAEAFHVQDKDIVEVRVDNEERSLTFGNVLVRVKDSYKLEMHIDTDEGNAAELSRGAVGELVETEGKVSLVKKNI